MKFIANISASHKLLPWVRLEGIRLWLCVYNRMEKLPDPVSHSHLLKNSSMRIGLFRSLLRFKFKCRKRAWCLSLCRFAPSWPWSEHVLSIWRGIWWSTALRYRTCATSAFCEVEEKHVNFCHFEQCLLGKRTVDVGFVSTSGALSRARWSSQQALYLCKQKTVCDSSLGGAQMSDDQHKRKEHTNRKETTSFFF